MTQRCNGPPWTLSLSHIFLARLGTTNDRRSCSPIGRHVLRNRTDSEGHPALPDRDAHQVPFCETIGLWTRHQEPWCGDAPSQNEQRSAQTYIQQSLSDLLTDLQRNLVSGGSWNSLERSDLNQMTFAVFWSKLLPNSRCWLATPSIEIMAMGLLETYTRATGTCDLPYATSAEHLRLR